MSKWEALKLRDLSLAFPLWDRGVKFSLFSGQEEREIREDRW